MLYNQFEEMKRSRIWNWISAKIQFAIKNVRALISHVSQE